MLVAAPCKHDADFQTVCSSLLRNAKLSHNALKTILGIPKHKNIDSTGVAMAKQAVTCPVPSQVVNLDR